MPERKPLVKYTVHWSREVMAPDPESAAIFAANSFVKDLNGGAVDVMTESGIIITIYLNKRKEINDGGNERR